MKNGLDFCYHQGDIDFQKVKDSGVDFIIPRDGWGVDSEKNGKALYADPKFIENVKAALAVGIAVPAVYHFIYAINENEARQNAACAINNVRSAGLPKETIIWCDLEYDTVDNARDYRGVNLSAADQRKIASAFCDYCIEQGYPSGVYVNQDYVTRVYGHDFLQKYDIWLADLEGEPAYNCVFRQTDWYARIPGIDGKVDVDVYYGQYTVGTAKAGGSTAKDEKKEDKSMGKPKSKEYLTEAFGVLDRKQGLNYKNWAPNNCGYCENDLSMSGDCWNINPKATVWSLFMKDPISKNFTPGKSYYDNGGRISGLPDVTGDYIMNNYCTKTTFKQMLASKKAPCLLLINGCHMGAYVGEYTRDGKIYNVSEFSPNDYLGGKMRSYVDEYGRRLTHKGGTVIGTWNQCGYLTALLDYSDWDGTATTITQQPLPAEEQTPETITDLTLALQIYKGEWGNNPGRQQSITAKYGAEKYKAAQKIVNSIVSAMNWYRLEVNLAEQILAGEWGNNPGRQENITLKYGANAYRIAQMFVNSIAGEKEYSLEDLKNGLTAANGILCGIYGNDPERTKKIVAEYGKNARTIAQNIVNDILK